MAADRPPASGTGASPETAPAAGGDPSMEDILASIRRILNEDEPPAGPTRPAEPDETEPLTLTEDMLVEEEPAATAPAAMPPPLPVAEPGPQPAPPTPQLAPVPVPLPASPPLAAPPAPPATPVARPADDAADALLAPAAAAAATASVSHLLRAVAAERGSTVSRGGPSIEDVVREELRPLLKDWLDQHLPALVERLVRSEIERLVGRALS